MILEKVVSNYFFVDYLDRHLDLGQLVLDQVNLAKGALSKQLYLLVLLDALLASKALGLKDLLRALEHLLLAGEVDIALCVAPFKDFDSSVCLI